MIKFLIFFLTANITFIGCGDSNRSKSLAIQKKSGLDEIYLVNKSFDKKEEILLYYFDEMGNTVPPFELSKQPKKIISCQPIVLFNAKHKILISSFLMIVFKLFPLLTAT